MRSASLISHPFLVARGNFSVVITDQIVFKVARASFENIEGELPYLGIAGYWINVVKLASRFQKKRTESR